MDIIWLRLVTLLLASQLAWSLIAPNVIRSCVNSTQIQPADLALFYDTKYLVVTKPAKCYVKCISDLTGITEKGLITEDFIQISRNAGGDRFKVLSEVCNNLNVEGECEATFEAFKCYMQHQA